jgi:hypothetical protein
LEKIDRGLTKIGETVKESKEFSEGVDRKFDSISSASQRMKDPPDGIITGPQVSPGQFNRRLRIVTLGVRNCIEHAEEIHARLKTVHQAAKRHSNSKKIRKAGDNVVSGAANLAKNKLEQRSKSGFAIRRVIADATCSRR